MKQPRCPSTMEWIKKYGTLIQGNITQTFQKWNDIHKWMDRTRKKTHPEWGNLDPERQIWYVLT